MGAGEDQMVNSFVREATGHAQTGTTNGAELASIREVIAAV